MSGGEGLQVEVMCKQRPKGRGVYPGGGEGMQWWEKSVRDRGTSIGNGGAKRECRVWSKEVRMGEWQERRRKRPQGLDLTAL